VRLPACLPACQPASLPYVRTLNARRLFGLLVSAGHFYWLARFGPLFAKRSRPRASSVASPQSSRSTARRASIAFRLRARSTVPR